ncbi:unnamed protein product [Vitrella brassicaformis CCMP3155]|uniref:Uncharacterized protein n=1 Tax=Vitrella brassicaformis (strain CCMP3155) TaxID=1169540 RepID=A0A0G4FU43_VITBC|nr:unnamed protein product [Vitrella brassicaformis CCMP3155]|eukprot:CEM17817.1 unnamed protein product [Vitrella brassicaformis CCMP3155]
MDSTQLVANAQSLKAGCLKLRDEVDQIIAQVSHVEQHQDYIATQAASPSASLLSDQLGSMASVVREATAQLQQGHPSLATAVAALTPTSEAAAASEDTNAQQVSVATGPSYRQIHWSGQTPPIDEKPARPLSREELANVFGHLQPWELARLRRHLGKALFHLSAARYTHLTISCEDAEERRLWAAMPLATAHKWGRRMTHLKRLRVRAPFDRPGWCLGHVVSITEGHADGRAALAAKQQQQHQSAEREASGGVAISTQTGDDGTLEELSFESVLIPTPPPTPAPLPAPSPIKTITLPVLTTVTAVPQDVARIRTDRSWLTPNVATLTFERQVDTEAAKEWVKGCKGLKAMGVLSVGATEEVLRGLPEDGKSLSRLRSLGGIELWSADADAIGRLRETLVARGAKGTLDFSSLDIIPPRQPSVDDYRRMNDEYRRMTGDRDRIEELAKLTADVVDADALEQPIRRCRGGIGRIAAGLVTWAHMHRCPWVRYIVNYLASVASRVVVSGDEGTAATITSDTFPTTFAIEVAAGALTTAEKRAAAASIASVMPKLGWAVVGSDSSPLTSAVGVVDFLTTLKSTMNITEGAPGEISLQLHVSSAAVSSAAELSGWQLGRRAADMPSTRNVQFTVHGDVDDGECGALLCNAIAILTSCTRLKDVDDVTMCFQSVSLASKMSQWWERFRPEAPEGFDTEFSWPSLTFRRRSPSTK